MLQYIISLYTLFYFMLVILAIPFLNIFFKNNYYSLFFSKIYQILLVLNFSGLPIFLGFFIKIPILFFLIKSNNIAILLVFVICNFYFIYFYLNFLKKVQIKRKSNILVFSKTKTFYINMCLAIYLYISFCAFYIVPICSIILYNFFIC